MGCINIATSGFNTFALIAFYVLFCEAHPIINSICCFLFPSDKLNVLNSYFKPIELALVTLEQYGLF